MYLFVCLFIQFYINPRRGACGVEAPPGRGLRCHLGLAQGRHSREREREGERERERATTHIMVILLTGVLQTGVFGVAETCPALVRKLAFRDRYASVFATQSNIVQVTRKTCFQKPMLFLFCTVLGLGHFCFHKEPASYENLNTQTETYESAMRRQP